MLVTQNIDDFHSREVEESKVLTEGNDPNYRVHDHSRVAFTPHVYEIHGNVRYMHCSDEEQGHSLKFFKAPSLAEFEAAKA